MVSVDLEVYLADNHCEKRLFGVQKMNPQYYSISSDTDCHCSWEQRRTVLPFKDILCIWFSDPEIYSSQTLFINKWKAFLIHGEIDALNSL